MIKQYQQAIAQYRQRIYSFARYSLRTREDAEDVTQDVLIKLWQHWSQIDHGRLNAWLMRVAHNQVIDLIRSRQFQVQSTDDQSVTETLAYAEPDIISTLDGESFRQRLMHCIKQLDDPFRSIIIMRDIQGQSYGDIQCCLGLSESQVKVYLHRARRKIRDDSRLRQLYESNSPRFPAQDARRAS